MSDVKIDCYLKKSLNFSDDELKYLNDDPGELSQSLNYVADKECLEKIKGALECLSREEISDYIFGLETIYGPINKENNRYYTSSRKECYQYRIKKILQSKRQLNERLIPKEA